MGEDVLNEFQAEMKLTVDMGPGWDSYEDASGKRLRENTFIFICLDCSLLTERRAKECNEESGER